MVKDNSNLFAGLYGVPESAKYLTHTKPFSDIRQEIDTSRLRYWIRTSVPYVAPMPFESRQRLITFYDLISMRMIAVLRLRNVGLKEIRNHQRWLRNTFNIKYPFVNRDLWTHGSQIYMRFQERLVSSSKFGQQAMEFIDGWLTKVEIDMEFDEYDLASSWHPYMDVSMNPRIQLGIPCIEGTRLPTRTIWRKINAGDSPEIISNLFDISLDQIEHAIQWEQRLENNGNSTLISAGRAVKL